MKKFLFLAVLAFAFIGCSSDDDNSDFPLNGTVWEYKYTDGSYSSTETLEFYKETVKYSMVEKEDGDTYSHSLTGSYIYEHPNLSVTIDGTTLGGTISGNQFTTNSVEGERYVFVRK